MIAIELFCGTKSFAKVAQEHGIEVFTVDINPFFNPDLCIDIMELTLDKIPDKFRHPDKEIFGVIQSQIIEV